MNLASRIKLRRTELKLSQTRLADAAGISKTYLCELEQGATGVGADVLLKLARALDVSMDWLMTGADGWADVHGQRPGLLSFVAYIERLEARIRAIEKASEHRMAVISDPLRDRQKKKSKTK